MKVSSTKPRGKRIFKSTKTRTRDGRKILRPYFIQPISRGNEWWFDLQTGEWIDNTIEMRDSLGGCVSAFYLMRSHGYKDVYSLKAAKRAIANWNVPKGTKFKCNLPWVGYSYTIIK